MTYDPNTVRRQASRCYGPCECHCTMCDERAPFDAPVMCLDCCAVYCGDCFENEIAGCIVIGCDFHAANRPEVARG